MKKSLTVEEVDTIVNLHKIGITSYADDEVDKMKEWLKEQMASYEVEED